MTHKLTCMTDGGTTIARARREDTQELGEGFTTRMSEAFVPEGGCGGGDHGVSSRGV